MLITPDASKQWPDFKAGPIYFTGNFAGYPRLLIKGLSNSELFFDSVSLDHYFELNNCDNVKINGRVWESAVWISNCRNCKIVDGVFGGDAAGVLRLNYGTQDTVVDNCTFRRDGPTTIDDRVAILLIDGANTNNTIQNCKIINYTDGIQTMDRTGDPCGLAAGLKILNCWIGFEPGIGAMEGSENCLDFKHGGTVDNPIEIKNCTMFGARQNSGAGGYCVLIHRMAQYVHFDRCSFLDSSGGVFLNSLNQLPPGTSSYARFKDCYFSSIKTHTPEYFPANSGKAIIGNKDFGTYENVYFSDVEHPI